MIYVIKSVLSQLKIECGYKMRIVYNRRKSNDREDFIEDKIQLEAAILSGHNVVAGGDCLNAIVIGHGGSDTIIRNAKYPSLEQINKAKKYYNLRTFERYALREFIFCKFNHEAVEFSCNALSHPKSFVKFVENPKQTRNAVIDKSKDISQQLIDIYDYEFVLHEDGLTMVQDHIKMHYEYRIFVINGQPITGAGCVESNTPLENDILFDCKLEDTRGKFPVDLPEVADLYREFAQDIACPELAKEGMKDYVLDLFMDGNSNIGIIELNPIHKSGFYAIDYNALFNAITIDNRAI